MGLPLRQEDQKEDQETAGHAATSESAPPSPRFKQRILELGFFAVVGVAMLGWAVLLGWLVLRTFY
jgi:hypothetical protein